MGKFFGRSRSNPHHRPNQAQIDLEFAKLVSPYQDNPPLADLRKGREKQADHYRNTDDPEIQRLLAQRPHLSTPSVPIQSAPSVAMDGNNIAQHQDSLPVSGPRDYSLALDNEDFIPPEAPALKAMSFTQKSLLLGVILLLLWLTVLIFRVPLPFWVNILGLLLLPINLGLAIYLATGARNDNSQFK